VNNELEVMWNKTDVV